MIMASFLAKTVWDRLRMIQKKNVIVPIHSNPTQNKEFQQNCKKLKKKTKKHYYGFSSSQTRTRQVESDTKKKSYRSDPFQPNSE